jgi:ribosome maturation factor RimP
MSYLNGLVQNVQRMVENILADDEEGLTLDRVEIRGTGSRMVIRVFIRRSDGVRLDDCSRVSTRLSRLLDIEDLIPHRYRLEVSSPGIDKSARTR